MTKASDLPEDRNLWPCPTCGKLIKDHTGEHDNLYRCYMIAILERIIGEGDGWVVRGAAHREVSGEQSKQ